MNQRGFTFTEILIVLGVLLLFSAFFVVVINPVHRIQEARDDTREAHLNTILLGIEQKLSREGDWNCASLPTDRFREIGTGPGMYDLYSCLTPNYLSKYLVDPKEGDVVGNIDDGLVGHWTLDEGEGLVAYDVSGNGNHGILIDTPKWVDGKISGALNFTNSSYIRVENSKTLNPPEAITVSAWVKFNNLDYTGNSGRLHFIARKGAPDSLNPHYGWWFAYDNRNNQRTFNYTCFGNSSGGYAGGGNNFYEQQITFSNNQWYHISFSVGDSLGRLFIDGSQYGATKSFYNLQLFDVQRDLFLGHPNQFADNIIDDVRIYNRALSPEEIQDLYNYEYSSKYAIWQNPVTKNVSLKSLENETKEVSTGAPEVALDFDGENDCVSVPYDASFDMTDNNALSLAAWVKPQYTEGPYAKSIIGMDADLYTDDVSYSLLIHYGSNPKFYFILYPSNSSSISDFVILYSSVVTLNNWYYVVATYDGSLMKFYINGVNNTEKSYGRVGLKDVINNVMIGSNDGSNRDFNGQISDTRIYNRALSAEEVEQLYKGYDIRDGLVGHWPLNEGQGETAYDRSGNNNNGTLFPAIDGPTWTTK